MQIESLKKNLVVAILALSTVASAAKEYRVTDLGKGLTPISLNDRGDVILRQEIARNLGVWSNGNYSHLYNADGQMLFKAKMKNNGDCLITVLDMVTDVEQTYYGKQGQLQKLQSGLGWDINNSGQMTLSTDDESTNTKFNYLREPTGEWIDCGNQAGKMVWGLAINDAGQIAGVTDNGDAAFHGFVWDVATGQQSLTPLVGDISSLGMDINNKGQVVGYSTAMDSDQYGSFERDWNFVLWDAEGCIKNMNCKLSSSNQPLSINDFSEIIGELKLEMDTDFRSYYWEQSVGFIAAEDLLVQDTLWQVKSLCDINNNGQLLGVGLVNNEYHAIILTPIPEPVSALLLLAGVCVMRKLQN